MSKANALEEQMLELVNGERADAGLNPLRFNNTLNTSSEDHSSWMLDVDKFDHQGINGSSPHERMVDAGYQFEGNWHSGENIAYMSEDSTPGLASEVAELHAGLMNSPGHRANILNPDFTEIGIGIEQGQFGGANGEFDAVMISQNFAHTDAEPAVTEEPPVVPEDEVIDEVVTQDPPAEPEDEVTEEVVTEDPPVVPEDEVTEEVVTEDPPTEPEDEVTEEGDSFATDLWEMISELFDGQTAADSFDFVSFGAVTSLDGQGGLIEAEVFFFMLGDFGPFQQVDGAVNTDMAQIDDLETGAQLPDNTHIVNDLEICGGLESFFG